MKIYDKVDIFVCPSRFLQKKILELGFKSKTVYLPNFIDTTGIKPKYGVKEPSIVYVGRLSSEKGVHTLLDAMSSIPSLQLRVIGDGEMKNDLMRYVVDKRIGNVTFLGHLDGDLLNSEIRNAKFVVFPSECYENNPRVILEAFALGKPVIGSRIGGIPELIDDGKNGLMFQPGDVTQLCTHIKSLASSDEVVAKMGMAAEEFAKKFTPERHYFKLMEIYAEAQAVN
jgi:glycosyltransferase involved in cell wall biosynthesis